VDFARSEITVRDGKGAKDRRTLLPVAVRGDLEAHLRACAARHERDVAAGAGWVEVPDALDRKFPYAGREWPWQWVFPATRTYVHRESGRIRRHHLHETVLQQAVRRAALAAGLAKRVTCHTFRQYPASPVIPRRRARSMLLSGARPERTLAHAG
jgi:hypothetical protein